MSSTPVSHTCVSWSRDCSVGTGGTRFSPRRRCSNTTTTSQCTRLCRLEAIRVRYFTGVTRPLHCALITLATRSGVELVTSEGWRPKIRFIGIWYGDPRSSRDHTAIVVHPNISSAGGRLAPADCILPMRFYIIILIQLVIVEQTLASSLAYML